MSKRDEFVGIVLSKLINELTAEQMVAVERALTECVSDYEIEERNTEIVPADSFIPEYYGIYIARKKIAGRTLETLKIYNYYLMDFFLNKPAPIDQMDSTLMVRYLYDYQKRKGVGNNTLDQCRIILNGFFEWAANEGYIKKNFVGNLDPIKHADHQRQPLTEEEVVMLRDACETYRERAIIDTFLATGVRLSELVRIKWSDIDMNHRTIQIFGKGKKHRVVMFDSIAKVSLLKYKLVRNGDSPYVFVQDRYPFDPLKKSGVSLIVRRLDYRSGFTAHVSPHILRHTFATNALARGMSMEKLRLLLGHEEFSTTLIYAKVDMSQVEYEYRRCFGA